MASTNPGPSITSGPESQPSFGNVYKTAVLTSSLTPAAVATATTAAQSFTLSPGLGLVAGDQISAITPPSFTPAGVFPIGASVTGNDVISITWANVTAGSLTPPSGVYTIEINRVLPGFTQNAGYLNSI